MTNRNAGRPGTPLDPAQLDIDKMRAGVERELSVVNRGIQQFWISCGIAMLLGALLLLYAFASTFGLIATCIPPTALKRELCGAGGVLLLVTPIIFRQRLVTLRRMKTAVLAEIAYYATADRPEAQ